jgi:hypothetical protein
MEIVFSVTQEDDGGFSAECLSHDIFTQGVASEELRSNVREAVSAYFFDGSKPTSVRLVRYKPLADDVICLSDAGIGSVCLIASNPGFVDKMKVAEELSRRYCNALNELGS